MKDRRGTTSENNVIDIKKEDHSGRTMVIDRHEGVWGGTNKTMRQKKTTKLMEPGTRCLFEPINRFLKLTDMTGKVGINKPR